MRIATIKYKSSRFAKGKRLAELTEQLRSAQINILCCQGIERPADNRKDPLRILADTLGMTYSFSASGFSQNTGKGSVRGLSILAGSGAWMLNSGSIPLPESRDGGKQFAQFAVIRKDGKSVLVVNTELPPDHLGQVDFFRAVLAHQLLRVTYGAVILCGSGELSLSWDELKVASAASIYSLDDASGPAPVDGKNNTRPRNAPEGYLIRLSGKKHALPVASNRPGLTCHLPPCALATEIDFWRTRPSKDYKLTFPLSFSEQWLGSRDSFRAFSVLPL